MSDSSHNSRVPSSSLPIFTSAPREKDPVCGMSVDPAKAAGKVQYGGKTYYFCSARCAGRFSKKPEDRKSTRLNSSHLVISYAVFCLKKKKKKTYKPHAVIKI